MLKSIVDWYAETLPELPPGEARIHTGAKIGYSVWIVVQAAIARVFMILDQYVLAIFYALGVPLTAFCFRCLVTGRPAIGFVAVNI